MSDDLALDFGSAITRIADDRGFLLLEEPTIAAVDADTGRLLGFGKEVAAMGVPSAGRVVITHPVREGQLADLLLAEDVLGEMFGRVGASRLSRLRILVTVHVNETNVQRRALERALKKAGARAVQFVEQPIACAVGAGLAISEPKGAMAVDVGAGTTDIGVMALGGLVTFAALRLGGDAIDDALRNYIARVHAVTIDHATAEGVKLAIGTVSLDDEVRWIELAGRAIESGRPTRIRLASTDLVPLLSEILRPICLGVMQCIAEAPPDLANDLLDDGLVLGGGGSALSGFDRLLARRTGIPVHVSPHRGSLGVLGAARCLRDFDTLLATVSPGQRR